MDVKQSLMEEFIDERINQYEKFFASPLWRKSLAPFLKAHYEIAIRSTLQKTSHMDGDIQTGRALALEAIINLPKAVEYRASLKTTTPNVHNETKLETYYEPDFDAYTPQNLYEGE